MVMVGLGGKKEAKYGKGNGVDDGWGWGWREMMGDDDGGKRENRKKKCRDDDGGKRENRKTKCREDVAIGNWTVVCHISS